MEEFTRNADDNGCLIGNHSICKYVATHDWKCGCSKDEKDVRGGGKFKGQVSNVYNNVELPYPDAICSQMKIPVLMVVSLMVLLETTLK
jgi:hypothetical protein